MKAQTAAQIEEARRLFPHTKKISYFNSASSGPICEPARKALVASVEQRVASERDGSHDAFEIADELRGIYAKLIGATKRSVGLGMNTSHGLNLAAFGLPLNKGDEVLVSDVEFPAVVYTFKAAAEARGLKLKFIPSKDRCFDIDAFKTAITKQTRVLALSYVQFFNGFKNDLKTIGEICRKHKIFLVVDGIQGMGVEPINVRKLGIDVFASGCHKWMLSPQGGGFFYVSDEISSKIKPPFMSWLSVDWKEQFSDLLKYDRNYFDSAQKFEMGYHSVLNLIGMKVSATIIQDLGIGNIREHNHGLVDRLASFIKSSSYYRITSEMKAIHRSSIFTFACDDPKDLHRDLLKEKIILVSREGSIRVSVHLFNDDTDIDKLTKALEKFAKDK
jgi:selenocysteine lyase/cysteine desulfurase